MVELINIERGTRNGVDINDIPTSSFTSTSFHPRPIDLAINACWFLSLSLSLATALIAVVAKQWIHQYTTIPSGSPRDRARIRHFRFLGLEKWRVPEVVGLLPTLMHLSLGIFFVGLAIFLHDLNPVLAGLVDAVLVSTLFAYCASNLLPLIAVDCPYKTPLALYSFPIIQRILYKFRRVVSDLPNPTSLRDAELDAVSRRANETDVRATSWLLGMSSNSSVQTIVLEALSNLPLNLLSSFRALAPPNLPHLIFENANLTWDGADTTQADRNLRAHLRFSADPKFLPMSRLVRLAKQEFEDIQAIDNPSKYLFIDLHYPDWVRVSRFSSVQCSLPIITTALTMWYDAPRFEPLVWIMFFNLAARWGTFRKKEVFQAFLDIAVRHPPVRKMVALPDFDTKIAAWTPQAETFRKPKYPFSRLRLDYSAIRKPFPGSEKTRSQIVGSHIHGHTLPHTLKHLVFSSFCDFLLSQLDKTVLVTDQDVYGDGVRRMEEKIPTHLRLLLHLAASGTIRRDNPGIVSFAIVKLDDYARCRQYQSIDDGVDWAAEAQLILRTVGILLLDPDFLSDPEMAKAPTKRKLSVHGKLLATIIRVAEYSRDEFQTWLEPSIVTSIVKLSSTALTTTTHGSFSTFAHSPRSDGPSLDSGVIEIPLACMPLVSLFEAAQHSRLDLSVPLFKTLVERRYFDPKVRVPECYSPVAVPYIAALEELSKQDEETFVDAVRYMCRGGVLFRTCRSLFLDKEHRSLWLLARYSYQPNVVDPNEAWRWSKTLESLKKAVLGYPDWDVEKKTEFAQRVGELQTFIEDGCTGPIPGDAVTAAYDIEKVCFS